MYEIVLILTLTVISERLAEIVMNSCFIDETKKTRAVYAYVVTTIFCVIYAVPLKLNLFAVFDVEKGLIMSLLTASIMGLGTQWVHYVFNAFSGANEIEVPEVVSDGGIPKTSITGQGPVTWKDSLTEYTYQEQENGSKSGDNGG